MAGINRRDFMRCTVITAGVAIMGLPLGCNDNGGDDISDEHFPQSVASGDPKANSIILWTRVQNPGRSRQSDIPVILEMAMDEDFNDLVVQTQLTAMAAHDNCVKAKVVGLSPWTSYYYRFRFQPDTGSDKLSRTGVTKTAPSADMDLPVKFGLVVCQDYIDGYFNAYAMLLEKDPDLDFIVHTGDYIYEYDRGTGLPGADIEDRLHGFPSLAEGDVVTLHDGSHAARSLENYRYLYKTYHGDAMMQRVHERIPMINIWDDHEYSDDCHGGVATYFNGRKNELDPERRRNAEQAFFEFLPYDEDYADTFQQTAEMNTPMNQLYQSEANPGRGCYRSFRFGKHLDLFMSDYRTYRPDHLIPEDAFPGTIVMDRNTLIAFFESLYPGQGQATYDAQAASFDPYLDPANLPEPYTANSSLYLQIAIGALTASYVAEGLSEPEAQAKATADMTGNVSAMVFNQVISSYNAVVPADQQLPLIDNAVIATLPAGLSYALMGKQATFSSTGSRYGVVKTTYDLYYAFMTQGQPQNVFGTIQQTAIDSFIGSSDATYIALASSVSTNNMIWDLREQDIFAPTFNQAFYANVDGWDGFQYRRLALLSALQARGNAMLLCGDIHASFCVKWDVLGIGTAVADFTCSSISSTVFNDFVKDTLSSFETIFNEDQMAAAEQLLVTDLDQSLVNGFAAFNGPASALKYANTTENGYVAITVDANGATGVYRTFPHTQAKKNYYDELDKLTITEKTFVYNGMDVIES